MYDDPFRRLNGFHVLRQGHWRTFHWSDSLPLLSPQHVVQKPPFLSIFIASRLWENALGICKSSRSTIECRIYTREAHVEGETSCKTQTVIYVANAFSVLRHVNVNIIVSITSGTCNMLVLHVRILRVPLVPVKLVKFDRRLFAKQHNHVKSFTHLHAMPKKINIQQTRCRCVLSETLFHFLPMECADESFQFHSVWLRMCKRVSLKKSYWNASKKVKIEWYVKTKPKILAPKASEDKWWNQSGA